MPEGVLTEDGQMDAFNNDLVIRYLDRVVVKDDGYEVVFKAGVTVEVEVWGEYWAAVLRVVVEWLPAFCVWGRANPHLRLYPHL
jgi:hypothetical protein